MPEIEEPLIDGNDGTCHSAVASPPATASPLSQAASSSEQVVSEEMRLGRGTFGNTGMKGIPWASRQSQAVKGDSLFELHTALSPLPSRRRKDADGDKKRQCLEFGDV